MKVKCAECGKRYKISDSLVNPAGIKVRCPNCNNIIPIYPDQEQPQDTEKTMAFESSTQSTSGISTNATTPYSISNNESPAADEGELDASLIQKESGYDYEATNVQEPKSSKTKKINPSLPDVENSLESSISEPSYDEISLGGEISQVSFDSDATFRDHVANLNRAKTGEADATPAQEEPTPTAPLRSGKPPVHSQPSTIINPKPPIRSEFSPHAPTAILSRQDDEPTSPKILRKLPPSLTKILLAIGAIVLCLFTYQAILKGTKKNAPPIPTASPTPQVTNNLPIPTESPLIKLAQTGIDFCSRISLQQVSEKLTNQLQQPNLHAWFAYIQALRVLFYNEETSRDIGIKALSEALIEDANNPQAILASALFAALDQPNLNQGSLNAALNKLKLLHQERKLASGFIDFVEAVAATREKNNPKAQEDIEAALSYNSSYGPFLVFATRFDKLSSGVETVSLLKEHQARLQQEYPDYKDWLALMATQPITPTATPTPMPPVKSNNPTLPKNNSHLATTKTIPKTTQKSPGNHTPAANPTLQELLNKADALYKKEQYNEALTQYKAAEKIAGTSEPIVLIRLGFTWFKLYRLDEAYNLFNKAVTMDNNIAEAHKGLGMVYDQLGDLEKSAREFNLYLQLKPNAPDANEVRENLKKLKEP
jgi:predicted Zn finger-like uncharacterized protein